MLLAVLDFALRTYGWRIGEATDAPMLMLMLLMRQKLAGEGHVGISLQDKEAIDSTPWEELVRRNRESLSAALKA